MPLPHLPSFRLDGKRALVAGASRGIGLGCAAALAEAGAQVVCAARSEAALQEVVAEMAAEGWQAEALALDVADVEGMMGLLEQQAPFHVVVNSAGIARHTESLDTTLEDYQAVMDVNVRGAYFLSVAAAKAMVKAQVPGSIIHISSQMGHIGGTERAVYCASKHAVEGMVKAMAIEWGCHGIRINTIGPTFIRTALTEPTLSDPQKTAWVMEKIKLGRVGEVEDIMGAVLYLAGDASAMVTGTSLLVDGGWTAG